MKMTPALLIIGGLLVFWASTFVMIGLPAMTVLDQKPSDAWRALTAEEEEGHLLYRDNGCVYCHSNYIRNNDWGIGAERIAQAGDYAGQEPPLLGSERTGPDLSQEGGEHPDDWQIAHFINPRYTRPRSLMPSWEFLGQDKLHKLTVFLQSRGGKLADERVARQKHWKQLSVEAYALGPAGNVQWLHDHVPPPWRAMPNPYPADAASLARGKRIYQDFCINCHGPVGDGQGSAARYLSPPPLNFTELRKYLVDGKYIGGIFYYQVMNGITGTAMPYFKKDLESEKIWDVSNYIAVQFVGYTDANIEPRGIDAAYEPEWTNPYQIPQTQPTTRQAQDRQGGQVAP
jgi:cytochrome c oxidase cbb3-type subunit II